jgi:hypothetical protein
MSVRRTLNLIMRVTGTEIYPKYTECFSINLLRGKKIQISRLIFEIIKWFLQLFKRWLYEFYCYLKCYKSFLV